VARFPQDRLLPGVAQLSAARTPLREVAATGRSPRLNDALPRVGVTTGSRPRRAWHNHANRGLLSTPSSGQ
jgi:hypothetical protein